jgi:hypothetical protein
MHAMTAAACNASDSWFVYLVGSKEIQMLAICISWPASLEHAHVFGLRPGHEMQNVCIRYMFKIITSIETASASPSGTAQGSRQQPRQKRTLYLSLHLHPWPAVHRYYKVPWCERREGLDTLTTGWYIISPPLSYTQFQSTCTPVHPTPHIYILPLPISIGCLLQVTNQWRHLVSILHGGSMRHPCFFFQYYRFVASCGSTWFISPPRMPIIPICWSCVILALHDLCRRRWCLHNWCRLGSMRVMSPLMVSSQLVSSWFYASHVAADGIFTIGVISALRDLCRRR